MKRFIQDNCIIIVCLFATLIPLVFYSSGMAYETGATEKMVFMEIDDVISAARHTQLILDAPASVTVITDEDISRYGHRSLTDVVKNVRSFYTYSDRTYDYIGVRGFARLGDYGNRVLQLVDGHTYNDNIYGTFFLGEIFGVDMHLVKRIEFVRGPGSALYGTNAALGTVNIMTKKGDEFDGIYVKGEVRSYNTQAGGFIFGKAYDNGLDVLISVSLFDSKGQDHYYEEFGGWARDADGEKAKKLFLKMSWQDFSLSSGVSSREKNVPTASYDTIFNDNRLKAVDERDFAELKWEHAIDQDRSIMSRVYYDRYWYKQEYPFDYPPVTINRDESLGQWIGAEANYSHKVATSHILLGGETAWHINADQKSYDVDPYAVYVDDHHSYTSWSAYIQDEWDVISRLRLIAAFRYDEYSTFGSHFSPRMGVILKPTHESVIKLLYGQAFRAPNVFELYYQSLLVIGGGYKANPDLKPETFDTWEAIWEQEINPAIKTSLSAFRYQVKDLITQVLNAGDNTVQFQNINRVRSDGIEMGIEINWPDVLKGHISYTRQETYDDLTGQLLPNSPRHLVKAGASIPVYRDRYFLGAQCRYMSKRIDRNGGEVGDNLVSDINIEIKNLVRNMTISMGVYNIFDETYFDPVSTDHVQTAIRQDGRNYRLKIDYLF